MTKQKLQKEIITKVKPGVKPSDLRKNKTSEERSLFNSDILSSPHQTKNNQQLLTPPPTPPLKPSKEENLPPLQTISPPDSPLLKPTKPSKPANNLQDLQQQVNYWSQTAQNHLLNLSKTSAELFNAEERIKELERQKPASLNKEAEKALIEANSKIRKLMKINEELQAKIQEKKAKPTGETKPKETREIGTQTEEKLKYYLFTCDICEQNKKSQLHLARVNGLGIDPNKQNKICDACIRKVDTIQERKEEFF